MKFEKGKVKKDLKNLGLNLLGFMASHAGARMIPEGKDNLLVNAGITAASLAGTLAIQNEYAKPALIGSSMYFALKTAKKGIDKISQNQGAESESLEGIKETISKFVPTLSGGASMGYIDEEEAAVLLSEAEAAYYETQNIVDEPVQTLSTLSGLLG